MKKPFTLLVLTMLLSMVGVNAFAYNIAVENSDGITIYYNYINNGTELEVTKNIGGDYSGTVAIPEQVTYMNRTRTVTSIGVHAFSGCYDLTSVTIPNSVTGIGKSAFSYCMGLTTVTIPSSVTNIGAYAFSGCSNLMKVIVPDIVAWCGLFFGDPSANPLYCAHHLYSDENTEITDLVIPSNVTSIGSSAFRNCTGLRSVTIYEGVTSIGSNAFNGCTGLTSVTIPLSVTSIENGMFYDCTSLSNVTIPNSVKSIGNNAFYNCSGLTSVTIPNSVTSIGNSAFSECTGLTEVTIFEGVAGIGSHAFEGCLGLTSMTIPSSVTSIGDYAFYLDNLLTIVSFIEEPFLINPHTFSFNSYMNATLYVPVGTIDKYKAIDNWRGFVFIEEGNGECPPEIHKCEKPTIRYSNGSLSFDCATDGVDYVTSITDSDINTYYSPSISLGVTYNINVYATKTGYQNSEIATASLCWIDVEPQTEGITDAVASIKATPVLIQSEDGRINITGADEGTLVYVYNVSGQKLASVTIKNNEANIFTDLQPGNIAVIKIGNRSVKVIMK